MNSEKYNITKVFLNEFDDQKHFDKFLEMVGGINEKICAWNFLIDAGFVNIWQRKENTVGENDFAVSEKKGEINCLRLEFVTQERAFEELQKSAEYSLWIFNGLNWKEIE